MSGQRISYPGLAGELVDSVNALLSAGELRFAGDGASACSIAPFHACEDYETSLTLGVAVGGSPLRVRLNRPAVEAALGPLLSASDFAALDDDLKLAVLETALDEPLGALRELSGADVVLESLDSDPAGKSDAPNQGDSAGDAAVNSLVFEVRVPADVVRCRVQVELLSALPASVLAKLASVPNSGAHGLGGLPVPVTFELGEGSLSAAEISSLEPGDIVLFDQCHILEGRVRVNVCDSFYQVGTLDGLNLTVENSS